MRKALLAFLLSRAFLLGVLAVVPPLTEWRILDSLKLPYGLSQEEDPLPWKEGRDGRHYLYHPARLVDAWLRQDAAFYLQAAYLGYGKVHPGVKSKEGFFPGYPWLMKLLSPLLDPIARGLGLKAAGKNAPGTLAAALFISHTCSLLCLVLLVFLGRRFLPEEEAGRAGILFAVSPVSFIFGAGLSESLFLALVLAAFCLEGKGGGLAAGILGAGAAFVRSLGVVVALPLLVLARARRQAGFFDRFLALLLIPCGWLLALLVIAWGAGRVDAYFAVQKGFGHGAFPTWRGVAELFTWQSFSPYEAARNALQVLALLLALAALWRQSRLSLQGRLPGAYLLFSVPMLLLPLLSGSIISLPRYVAVIFPFYFVAAGLLPKGWRALLLYLLSLLAGGLFLLSFEAHLPLII